MTGLERLRKVADELKVDAECDELHRIHGDEGDHCNGRSCGECQREALRIIANQIEREQRAGDTTMSAYDLLPDEDREAIAWVRERGGLAEVVEYYEYGRRIEPWNEQKADLYELMNECGGVEELKKRLMPEGLEWPRFEDGEPVRFGDVVSDGDETGRVYYVTFDTVNPVIIGFTDETPDQDPGTWLEVSVNYGERVKRPVVLAADGEPLEVGQTVYVNATGKTHHVTEVDAVFKRFRSMEQVDGSQTGSAATVKGFDRMLGEPCAVIDFAGIEQRVSGTLLTHEQPDSWERLEADAGKNPFDYCKDVGHRLDTCENSEAYKARDLVRRAKKLAERGA